MVMSTYGNFRLIRNCLFVLFSVDPLLWLIERIGHNMHAEMVRERISAYKKLTASPHNTSFGNPTLPCTQDDIYHNSEYFYVVEYFYQTQLLSYNIK